MPRRRTVGARASAPARNPREAALTYLLDTNTCIRYLNGRFPQVTDQNAVFTGSDGEDLRVGPADDVTLRRGLKVDRGLSPEKTENNLLVEVRVGQEARFHGRELGIERRAPSGLAYRAGYLRRDSSRIRSKSARPF